jgi:hypothetical protein
MADYGRIKEGLLKSGLPLESMIAEDIDSLSAKLPHPLINMGEHSFGRRDAALPGSVDFLVTYDLDIENCDFLQIAFLIESKYRTRGTRWYFIPSPLKDSGMEFFVENFVSKGKCSRKTFPMRVPPLNDTTIPISGKGTEIYSNGEVNQKSISEALHQLMFAASSLLTRAFLGEKDLLKAMHSRGINIEGRSFHSLICPMIVTNSDFCTLEGVNIERIEQSTKPDDIAKSEKIVVYSTPRPPLYVARYIKEDVARDVESMLHPEDIGRNWAGVLAEYSVFFPSRFYIVGYRSLVEFMEKYITFASSLLAFACRKNK